MRNSRYSLELITEEQLAKERFARKLEDMPREELEKYCHQLHFGLFTMLEDMNSWLESDRRMELTEVEEKIDPKTTDDIFCHFLDAFIRRTDVERELRSKTECLEEMRANLKTFDKHLKDLEAKDDIDKTLIHRLRIKAAMI